MILFTALLGAACRSEPPGLLNDNDGGAPGSYNPTPAGGAGGELGGQAPVLSGDEAGAAEATPILWSGTPGGVPDRAWLREVAGVLPLAEITPPHPPNNPAAPKREALGRLLFFDPILGGERDVSCATCHHPDFGWADGLARSVGVGGGGGLSAERRRGFSAVDGMPLEETARNAPTVLNTGLAGRFGAAPSFLSVQFWDGRVDKGLEAQALLPLGSADEMAGHAFSEQQASSEVVSRLREVEAYEDLFREAFPVMSGAESAITASMLARALAAFQRSLIALDSPFDQWLAGDEDALGASAKRGLALFAGEAGCLSCHHGPMFSDYRFHVIGTRQAGPGRPLTRGYDRGRFDVTGADADLYAFRTPPLRNVSQTAPYGHAGTYATLEEIVWLHVRVDNDAGLDPARIDPLLRAVDLDDGQMKDLVAFLESLEGELPAVTVPDSVPSGLPPIFGISAKPN